MTSVDTERLRSLSEGGGPSGGDGPTGGDGGRGSGGSGGGRGSGRNNRDPVPTRRPRWLLLAAPILIAALVTGGLLLREQTQPPAAVDLPTVVGVQPSEERARQSLGQAASGGSWFSGAWAAGQPASTARVNAFGDWRGTPVDAATVYPDTSTWQTIHDSEWLIHTYDGFTGVLAYGLPLLPDDGDSDFASVANGDHDWVFQKIATDLVSSGRGNTIMRIGWEANGDWFAWNTKASNAADYVAAYRHVVSVLRAIGPDLVIDFDLGCGTKLRGQEDRMDALNLLYPGDDAVDLVGCDFYDWHNTQSTDDASWERTIRPDDSVGIADVADFARTHGKGLTYPEWGVASTELEGVGDNPFFVQKVRTFFETNSDILVLEGYFSEPQTALANSIWDPVQMPQSSEIYRSLW